MGLELTLRRTIISEHLTIGELYINGEYYCDTLEPPVSAEQHPAIVEGLYSVVMYQSPSFRALRPLVTGVKGRSGILIHEGNWVKNTRGCILVGKHNGRGKLLHSLDTLHPLCRLIKDKRRFSQPVTLLVTSK